MNLEEIHKKLAIAYGYTNTDLAIEIEVAFKTLQKENEELKEDLSDMSDNAEYHRVEEVTAKEENSQLKERVKELEENEKKHIIMFASWLMDEGYLIDGEKVGDLNIKDIYDYWNIN